MSDLAKRNPRVHSGSIKSLRELPLANVLPVSPPPLESEPPHKRLARLTRDLAATTDTLRELKKTWAERNIKAQATRTAIATTEITHFENQKRTLALAIQDIQTQIGATNKLIRERKDGAEKKPEVAKKSVVAVSRKKPGSSDCPLKQHREYPVYFLLAARNELTGELFQQIERSAKSLLAHALNVGLEI